MLLSQHKNAQEILERAGISSVNLLVLVDTKFKLSADASPQFHDPPLYRSLQVLFSTSPLLVLIVLILFSRFLLEAEFYIFAFKGIFSYQLLFYNSMTKPYRG